jgi:hypothetical protein
MNLKEYKDCFENGTVKDVSGICGRIIRGIKPEDFETLTDDPDRKLVMLLGPDGLQSLLGKTGEEMLIEIGYEKDYIKRKVDEGNSFKLVIFPEGDEAGKAYWFEVLRFVSKAYPAIRKRIQKYLVQLRLSSFEKFEKEAGFIFSEVDKIGKEDDRFMTYDRYINSEDTLLNLRSFLYFTVHLRELFTGNGYTKTYDGKKGLSEYIAENKKIF